MQKIIILIILFFCSCNRLPDSKGEYNDVIIIASKEDKILIESE